MNTPTNRGEDTPAPAESVPGPTYDNPNEDERADLSGDPRPVEAEPEADE